MINRNSMVIGNVVRELGFGNIGIGNSLWRWRKRYFWRFRIDPRRYANPHIVIVGGSGGGKSNACKMIIRSLCDSGANVAVLDPHNEYIGISEAIGAHVYDASKNGINMFDLDGMSEKERASEITGMLKRNFRLGEVQSYMLYRCIMYAYSVMLSKGKVPNIHNLVFAVKAFKRNAKLASEKAVLESLERRLALIETGAFGKSADMGTVIRGRSIFLLSGLHTPESQSIYIEGFLRKVYSLMLSMEKSDLPKFYAVIDEAEKLGDNPIIGKIAAEGRKYGIGIIAISQRAKLIDKDLRGNASMLVSFGIKEPEELNYVSNFISGGNELGRFAEVKKALRNMPRGHALVAGANLRNPLMVRFDRSTNESENIRFIISCLASSGIRIDALRDSVRHPEDLDAAMAAMVESGELKVHDVDCGRYSGKWCIYESHNSAEHDIALKIISAHLLSRGIANRLYNNSYGPDIVAFPGGNKVAIEYETGSKDINSTARMLAERRTAYGKVITVVNDAHYAEYAGRFENVVGFSRLEKDMGRFLD